MTRFVFVQAGVKYEDVRIEGKDWPAMKPSTPFGFMPVLEVDGKKLSGSKIIPRYLAEEFGLAGKDAFQNAEIAGIVDAITDIENTIIDSFMEKDETKKGEQVKKLLETTLPEKLAIFEKLAAAGGWLFGSSVTWADFAFYQASDYMIQLDAKIFEKYPALAKVRASVEVLPNIAKWLKERPETPF